MALLPDNPDQRYDFTESGWNNWLVRARNIFRPTSTAPQQSEGDMRAITPEMRNAFAAGIGSNVLGDQGIGSQVSFGHQYISVDTSSDIQIAIDKVSAAGGGIVRLVSGTYHIQKNIVIPSFVTLQGDGRDGTILDFGGTAYGITVTGTATSLIKNVRIKDLTIQNSSATAACDILYAQFFILDNVHFTENTGHGIRIRGSKRYTVFNCLSDYNSGEGYYLAGASGITHERFNFIGCVATDNASNGFYVYSDGAGTLSVKSGSFVSCESSFNVNAGFRFEDLLVSLLTYVSSCVASHNEYAGFYVAARFNTIVASVANNNTSYGFEVQAQNNTIVGCNASGNGVYNYYSEAAVTSLVSNVFEIGTSIAPSDSQLYTDTPTASMSLGNSGGNTRTESILYRMKNTSGSSISYGSVVVFKSAADGDEITTTTTAADDKVFGVAISNPIGDGDYGSVRIEGFVNNLKVNGTTDIAVGDFLGTYTTAGIAAKITSGMAFAIALEAYTTNDSSGVIDALIIKPRKIGTLSTETLTTTAKARAYKSGAQNISTIAKVQLDAESYDTGSNFDSSTNYRFTAPTTGYYIVCAALSLASIAANKAMNTIIRKNGTDILVNQQVSGNASGNITGQIADIVSLTAGDYLELYGQTDDSDRAVATGGEETFMSVHLIST